MAKKNSVENIVSKLPDDTKLVEFNIGSDGNIESVEVKNITNIIQNDVMAVNVVLQAFLSAFGIDIASIARSAVSVSDNRLIDIRNLLINAKWEQTNVTIDSSTKKAIDWIKIKFAIYDKGDFIDTLFRRIADLIFESDTDVEYNIIKTDDTTYQMIKLIAMCYGADVTFTSVPIGDVEVMPTQGYTSQAELTDILEAFLKSKGYVSSDATITISNDMWQYLSTYDQISMIIWKGLSSNVDSVPPVFGDRWTYSLVPSKAVDTGAKITDITWDQFSVSSSYTYDDGGAYTGKNRFHPYYTTINLQAVGGQLNYTTICPYRSWEYNANDSIFNLAYDGTMSRLWSRFRIAANYNQPTIGIPHDWSYRDYPTETNWSADADVSNQSLQGSTELINGSYEVRNIVPAPEVDSTVTGAIGSFDLLNILNKYPLFVGLDAILETLNVKTGAWDTCVSLKTDRIDINDGTSLRTGLPYDDIVEDISHEYITKFSISVDWINNSELLAMSPCEWYSVIVGVDEFNKFNQYLWKKSFWQKLAEDLVGLKPMDCLKDICVLPFNLSDKDVNVNATRNLSLGGYLINDVDCHDMKRHFRVLATYPIAVGFKESYENGKKIKVMEDDSFLNYEPYTTASIYIPFVGERQLEMSMIMYKYLYLEYRVFLPTGDFVANVCVYDFNDALGNGDTGAESGYINGPAQKKAYPIMSCVGNMAIHFPLASREQTNAIDTLTGTIGGLMGSLGGAMSGNPVLAIGGGMQAASSILAGTQGNIRVNGSSMGGYSGFLSNWQPYLTLFKHECIKGYSPNAYNSAFNETIGMKSERGIKIRNMDKGYHKIKGVKLQGIKCTESERQMIENILLSGFYTATVNENKEE